MGSVSALKGSEVAGEVRSELSPSVLRWLLQECFSPGGPLAAPPRGLRMVPLSQGVRDCGSGGEEVRGGTPEADATDMLDV